MRDLIICETPDDVADAAADLIFESEAAAISARGAFNIALSGGEALQLLYERLASEEWRDALHWPQWEMFWCDERALPPESENSNYRLVHDTLLCQVEVENIWRMRGEAADLNEAAAEYARTLRSRLGPGSPVFDIVLLEMGADGSIASLFPGHRALVSAALVEAVEVEDPIRHRITLTLPVLNAARQVLVLATGTESSACVREILEHDDSVLPAARLQLEKGDCLWILDHEAARLIR